MDGGDESGWEGACVCFLGGGEGGVSFALAPRAVTHALWLGVKGAEAGRARRRDVNISFCFCFV